MTWRKTAKRHATTLVLSAVAAFAGLYVFVIDRGAVTTQDFEQRKRNFFPVWRVDEISSVTIERSGKTSKLARRAADANGQRFWDITLNEGTFGAEQQQVDQLLGTLEFGTYERVVEAGSVDAKTLGFDLPRLRVSVTMGERSMTLTLGANASSPPGAVFAEVKTSSATNLYVINKELAAALDNDPALLRARRLVPYATTDIARFEIVSPNGSYSLEPVGTGGTEMRLGGSTADAKNRVARRPLDEFVATLGRTDAASFLADDAADKALGPAATLTFFPKDTSRPRGVLVVGGACPDNPEQVVAIQREPARVSACVTKEIADGLTKSSDSFADKGLFLATVDEVEEVTFISGNKRLELARKGKGFHQRSPVDRDIDAGAGRKVLEALLDLHASKVITDADRRALGLDKPAGSIRLTSLLPARGEDGGDEERNEEIFVGAIQGDEVAVARGGDGAVLMLPASAVRDLFPDDIALRSLTVIDAPETAVRALRIEQGDRVQRIERTEQGGWRLAEPVGKGLTADIGLGSDVVITLFPLVVERFVAGKDDGSFGLDKPRITIDADVGGADAGPKGVRLLIGAPTTSGSFGRLEGDPAVFVVPRNLEAAASQWLLDRTVFVMDINDIVRVTVNQKDKSKKPMVLQRVGDVLQIVGAPNETSAAATLRDALSDLPPYAAVSIGAARKEQGLDPPAFTVVIERVRRDADAHDLTVDPSRTLRLAFGARDVFRGNEVVYVRREGIDATYVMARSKAHAFIDVLY